MTPRCPLFALVTALLVCGIAHAEAPKRKPNVLFLFTDDQRADTIAALGNPIIQTPNLDRLARTGVAFTRAYMQGGFNGATCVPSRAMLLSGRSTARGIAKFISIFRSFATWKGNSTPRVISPGPM